MDLNPSASNPGQPGAEALRQQEKHLEQLSPFEVKNTLLDMAREEVKASARVMLNAGRGNPNWIATRPREAFLTLSRFAIEECKRQMWIPTGVGGAPVKEGIASRFEEFMRVNADMPGMELLKGLYVYMQEQHAVEPDDLVFQWAQACAGDQYPTPSRILKYTQVIVRDYLDIAICGRTNQAQAYDLFATEGATAGMCYLFETMKANRLLKAGDHVALLVPIFSPYIEIPELPEFGLNSTYIYADLTTADGEHLWQYDPVQLAQLADPKFKCVYVVNPSNPPSYAMDPEGVKALVAAVKKNPNLMVITDDVYGTFVRGYRSLISDLPFNCCSVYSFSKFFGCTGWRLAVTAVNPDNVFDKLIAELPEQDKKILEERYTSLTLDVPGLKFIDRIDADSRLVALRHTSGLSLPQQMQMSLMAASIVLDKEGAYQTSMIDLVQSRYDALWEATGFGPVRPDPLRAGYYCEIDMMLWARKFYGEGFAKWLGENYNPLDVEFRVADTGAVVLDGEGFDGPRWSLRVSVANLAAEGLATIGRTIRQTLESYAAAYKATQK